jgi:hypothetical protein
MQLWYMAYMAKLQQRLLFHVWKTTPAHLIGLRYLRQLTLHNARATSHRPPTDHLLLLHRFKC